MYKLLIVEDEIWEREGLASFVDWSALNIEIAGTASNGIQGLQMAREYLPDIIIADIRMPLMDGLALSREVKNILPGCRIIIITGYDDFQYAKEALHIGVSGFLLKPIQKEELTNAINRVVEKIKQEKQQEAYINELRKKLTERTYKERERFLLNILAGNDKYAIDSAGAEELMLSFGLRKTVAVMIRFDGFSDDGEAEYKDSPDLFSSFYRKVRELVGYDGLTAENLMGKREILICLPAEGNIRNEVNRLVSRIQEENIGIPGSDYIIGIGSVADTISEFPASARHAEAALDRLFFMKDACIFYYVDDTREENDDLVSALLHSMPDYSKKILNAVISSNADEVTAVTNELFDFIYSHPVDKNMVCNFLAGMINELSILVFSSGAAPDTVFYAGNDILLRFQSCIKLERLKVYIQKILLHANEFFRARRKNKEEIIVEEAMNIISNEYNENIGLEIVAQRLGISANYLGSLFRKYVGKRFTEVLTSFRMKKAEELLLSGDYSIMDIAGAVGYDNISYFCTVFKKFHGVSPAEYREKYSYDRKNTE